MHQRNIPYLTAARIAERKIFSIVLTKPLLRKVAAAFIEYWPTRYYEGQH